MANGRRHGNRDTQFEPERREARAIDLDPSAGGLHQGAQPQCCRSDAVHMAATDQMPDPKKALAPREPSTHGSSAAANAAPVLDPGHGRTKTGYLWALARDDRGWGGADPPGVVYLYAPSRSGQKAEGFLRGFDGILQLDGYTGYNRLTRPLPQGRRSDPRGPLLGPRTAQAEGGVRPRRIRDRGRRATPGSAPGRGV